MNPYALLGAALAVGVAFAAGTHVGKRMERATCMEQKEAQLDGYLRKLGDIDAARDAAARKAADAQAALDAKIREKAKEVLIYVQSPAAAAACLDADGVRVWNRDAQAGAGPLRPVPDGPRPGDAGAAAGR